MVVVGVQLEYLFGMHSAPTAALPLNIILCALLQSTYVSNDEGIVSEY